MLKLNRKSKEPLYRQVERHVQQWIADGRYRPGQRLPSIRELSSLLGVNYLTARQAVAKLAADGVVSTSQGRGTYVSDPKQNSTKLALVLPNLVSPLSDQVASGIHEVMSSRGAEFSIFNSYEKPEVEVENINRIMQTGLQGAIIFSTMRLASIYAILRLILKGVPVVLVDRYFEDVPTWCATADNVGGAYQATQLLIKAGRRRIGFVSDVTNTTTRNRLAGYRKALSEAGVVSDESLLGIVPADSDDTRTVTAELLSRKPRPDAIFFGNDLRALLGIQVIKSLGLKIPDDIAVVGFDDMPMTHLSDPPLTTIRQDGVQLGRLAAELFWEQVRLDPEVRRLHPQTRVMPVEVVRRASA